MINNRIFFEPATLKEGNYYFLRENIQADNGRSYALQDWLGRGGNAAVFQCQAVGTGDTYAIKFLLRRGRRSVRRFEREVRLMRQIRGEHVALYHTTGSVKAKHSKGKRSIALHFLVMELAECNLADTMSVRKTPFEYEEYSGQFRGLARGLASIHTLAVHRDIKPENILIVGERWLLSDFGLCTYVSGRSDLTGQKENIGPKYWYSPEEHNRRLGCRDEISKASDVFQLAAIFWYAATGRHPTGIITEQDWVGPAKLFPTLQRALLHDPQQRPQNGEELRLELEDALSR